jgi:hypothetical protein
MATAFPTGRRAPRVVVVPAAPVVLPTALVALPPVAPTEGAPIVDIGFVLDTTGSMGGMLKAAKQKIWAIANEFADAQPRPRIRLGLVAYRDLGDDYVTKTVDLTEDLDAFYSELQALTPMGGGDAPEAVDKALGEAVGQLNWSEEAGLRFVFLVGDAPPHAETLNDCLVLARTARQQNLVLNAIQCGVDSQTQRIWSDLATAGGGKFFQIDQGARVIRVATPFDANIAAAQRRIEGTALFYGTRVQQSLSLSQWASNGKLPQEEAVSRSSCLSKTRGYYAQDLVQAVEEGRVTLATLTQAELPEQLRDLKPGEVETMLAVLKARRDVAKADLGALVAQRDAFLRENVADDASFDRQLIRCLKEQAASTLSFPSK